MLKNINPKSKYYGKYGISYNDGICSSYIHYFDGKTVYTKNTSFRIIKRFNPGDIFLGLRIKKFSARGWMTLDHNGGIYTPPIEEIMSEMKKYIHTNATMV